MKRNMIRLTTNIWFMEPVAETDRPILAIVKGSHRALMIDGANCPNHAADFLRELNQLGLAEADFIAITHSHCDHVFGLSALNGITLTNRIMDRNIRRLNTLSWNDAEVVDRVRNGQEHEMTARMLKDEMPGDRSGFQIRPADLIYETKLEVDLGGIVCRLEMIGGDHAADSTVVYVPHERVAFIGDCLYLRNKDQRTVNELLEKLLGFDADLYIDSHEVTPFTRQQLEQGDLGQSE